MTEGLGYKDAISDDYRIKPIFTNTAGLFSGAADWARAGSDVIDKASDAYFDKSNAFFDKLEKAPETA